MGQINISRLARWVERKKQEKQRGYANFQGRERGSSGEREN